MEKVKKNATGGYHHAGEKQIKFGEAQEEEEGHD